MNPPDRKNTFSSPPSKITFTGPALMPVRSCECPGVIPSSPKVPVATTISTWPEKISDSALTMLQRIVDMLTELLRFLPLPQ